MGLQIWLPLNASIYNQGLDGDAITNSSGITYASIGKIGSQSLLSGSMTTSKNYLGYEGTICFWIYITENSNKGMLYGNSDTGASLYNRKWSLFLYPTRNDLHCWGCQKDSKNNSPNGAWQLNGVIPDNKWTHICITHNRSMQYIYINGIQVAHKEWDSSGDITFDVSTPLMKNDVGRYLQDYRIYDNCLSPKQVKEISKGLICHYPLGEIDGKIGGRNLIKNGKGNVKAGFFKNFPTVTDEYGEFTLKSKKTYKGIILDGFVYECRDYPVGEKYTWSYDIMYTAWNFPTGSNRGELWMGQRYVNAPSGETATGAWRGVTQHNLPVVGQNGCELNKWYHVKQTVTIPQQASSNVGQQGLISFYNSNANVEASFTARLKNVKLEKSSTATPWTPAPEDNTSFYNNIIYDTSGYCNNGSVTDSTCPTWSSDTPKYKGNYAFNGNKQYVNCGTSTMIEGQEEITINCWAYMDDWTKFNARLFSCTEGGGYNTEGVNNSIKFALNIYITSDKSKYDYTSTIGGYSGIKLSDMASGWHMITCVYKASVGDAIYLDGKLYEKKTYTSYGIHFNKYSYLFLGGESSGVNCITPYFNGKLSDFRIYVTALSDSDILELYQSSASVDNNGNLMLAGEVIEE